ncbi:hypothetical protein L7F22_001536 [Adiantum nelumboides]|nr:hypothetical protein [Adiantum nelumboides]
MGWKGKLANKVGHYLSQSLEFPLKHLYTYPSPSRSGESSSVGDGFQEFQQRSGTGIETAGCMEDEYGPDTTSLTAFLLSLLSSSNNSSRRSSDSPEESDTEQDGDARSSLSGLRGPNKSNDDSSSNKAIALSNEGSERRVHPLQVDEDVSNSFKSRLQDAVHQAAPSASPRLPPMSEDSVLLSESFRAILNSAMPIIVKDRHWILLYSTAKHGISLRTMYRKSAALPDPFLLVVGDVHGATLGGLLTAPLKPTTKRKFLGTNEMFVFTNVDDNPRIFKATGANRYYLLCMNDAISLGGGGHFALHLDEDLLNGSSGACDTYGNHCLATSVDFTISHVELWGFAHATRYL